MISKRKLCVVTGTRADYGLLYWLMREIEIDPELILELIVTGSHLSESFGRTIEVIERDNFNISEKVDLKLGDDTNAAIAKCMGIGIIGMSAALERIKPDMLIILGDRYEILAAAETAMILRIPIAHIHGGEITEGAIDDSIRHAITKISQLHFVATDEYRKRVIQLGEHPERVLNVGSPGVDYIKKLDYLTRGEVQKALGLSKKRSFFMVTYHPETLSTSSVSEQIGGMLEAIDNFPEYDFVFTGVNADPGHNSLSDIFFSYANERKKRIFFHKSLGQRLYISAMKYSLGVIGNSSSGIIEAPALMVPTVNIGLRQKGRLKASSVVDSYTDKNMIINSINKILDSNFRDSLHNSRPPYGSGGASKSIKDYLKSVDIKTLNRKAFFDITFESAKI